MISIDFNKFKDMVNDVVSTNPMLLSTKQDVEGLKDDVRVLKDDVRVLKDDVRVLKDDVRVLKDDVRVLKDDVRVLKDDVKGLKENVFHQGVVQEEMRQHLRLILDAVIPAQRRGERLDEVEDKVEGHEIRLTAVERSIKSQFGGATK